ncbi:MAG: peptidylprolyl isomerase [Anaerolineae bacterium]|nr:peptidylprolyl isomerase [Anaerolineae bacterium]
MRRFATFIWFGVWVSLLLSACAPPTLTVPSPPPGDTPALPTETPAVAETEEAPAVTPTEPQEPLAALVNGHPLTLAEYERLVAGYEASLIASGQDPNTHEGQQSLAEGRKWVLETRVELLLITQAAAEQGVTVDDAEVQEAIDALITDIGREELENRLANEGLTLEAMQVELKREMIAARLLQQVVEAVPTQAEHVNARHIVVGTRDEAQRILNQIQAGADFAALAQAHSQDAYTREKGGDLDYVPRGILTSPEVENAIFSLQPGQISDIVQSALGYHIIQVVDRVPDRDISEENLRLLRDKAVRDWIDSLWAIAVVEYFVQ